LFGAAFDPKRVELLGAPQPLLDDVAASSGTSGGGRYFISNTGTLVYLSGKVKEGRYPILLLGPDGKWKVGAGKFPAWSPATQALLFLGMDDRIMAVSYSIQGDAFSAGPPRPWSQTKIRRNSVQQNFDSSPDGKHAVFFPSPENDTAPATCTRRLFSISSTNRDGSSRSAANERLQHPISRAVRRALPTCRLPARRFTRGIFVPNSGRDSMTIWARVTLTLGCAGLMWARDGQDLNWAYPVPDPAPAGGAADAAPKRLAGSSRSYTQARIDDQFNPPNLFPEEHAPLPAVVQVPRLAGIHPIYIVRQFYDFQIGANRSTAAAQMKKVAEKLSEDDMIAIAAYTASLNP
jgi:hypothetical protein